MKLPQHPLVFTLRLVSDELRKIAKGLMEQKVSVFTSRHLAFDQGDKRYKSSKPKPPPSLVKEAGKMRTYS